MERMSLSRDPALFERAEAAFRREAARIRELLPDADVQHIGSTAVPGSRTKGDLDLQVRVPQERMAEAEAALERLYDDNEGSGRTESFRSFKRDDADPPLGVQLTAIGSDMDFFAQLRDALAADPQLRERYDALKLRFDGESMDEYREAKAAFFAEILGRGAN
ncbi:GrpB family protein [Paenibacillus pasadenensis]|uniref:GrpB family protein n=1 Tax=Paenibacillus pasadenensis TaxID=217090 RepID=UPI0004105F5F|nr:GrpB family protein [Paenibacillus pasadenensis]